MKILIVDDEMPARNRLRALLEELGAGTVVGEAANGQQALQMAGELDPDVLLLDIQMPGMDGIETARHLGKLEHPPAVIFTTAFDEYALAAFDAHAVAYLLKPIRKEKLAAALDTVPRVTRAQLNALDEARSEPAARSHISARVHGNIQLVNVDEVRYLRADQKYVTVRHGSGEVLVDESLRSLESEFGDRFQRIHRNALVALGFLEKLEKDSDGHCYVCLRGIEDRLQVSRRHLAALRKRMRSGN